ncbi:MAG: hypothetical protein LBQ33_07165, partial [Oscillospiraceae bacterium]|jgi:F0F1-type ATP synthase alpha subunit|nr:hypothetical protein [Oscillospiraceae bacterium]
LLKQRQDDVMTLAQQTAVLVAFEENLFDDCPTKEVTQRRADMLAYLEEHCAGTLRSINSSGALSPADREMLVAYMKHFLAGKAQEA